MDEVLQFYAPPKTPVAERFDELYDRPLLASRGSRFAAHLIDSFLMMAAFFVPMFAPFAALGDQGDGEMFLAGLALAGLAVVGFAGINMWWLHHDGQTLGKKLVNIRIVRSNLRERASLARIIGLRFLPITIVNFFVPFATLVDALFIFGSERRCIHDLLADTSVVDASTWEPAETDFSGW